MDRGHLITALGVLAFATAALADDGDEWRAIEPGRTAVEEVHRLLGDPQDVGRKSFVRLEDRTCERFLLAREGVAWVFYDEGGRVELLLVTRTWQGPRDDARRLDALFAELGPPPLTLESPHQSDRTIHAWPERGLWVEAWRSYYLMEAHFAPRSVEEFLAGLYAGRPE